jgi:hypothetical protein
MECYRVVSYKLSDISELLTASFIRSMSEPREKDVFESGMLQSEHGGGILVKFNFKM